MFRRLISQITLAIYKKKYYKATGDITVKCLEYFNKIITLFKVTFPNFYELLKDIKALLRKHSSTLTKFIKFYFCCMFLLYSVTYGVVYLGLEFSHTNLLTIGAYLLKLYNFWTYPIKWVKTWVHKVFRGFDSVILKILTAIFLSPLNLNVWGKMKILINDTSR